MSDATMTTASTETLPFQAEVSRLLHLVVHSLYSHKEIFLRELVSNASDAIDRLRIAALTDPSLIGDDEEFAIRIEPKEDDNVLVIADDGVGMTRDELVRNLGTIAHSGTLAFFESLADKGDARLIGQFGVGFYSAFLVADRVEVYSRAAGADARTHRWSSDAKSSFTIEEIGADSDAALGHHGTRIVLHLNADQKDFARSWKVREVVRKYSDFVSHPILMKTEKDEDGDRLNKTTALWRRRPSDVKDEEYDDFYKHLCSDWDKPLARQHFHVEGNLEFSGLLFLPPKAPFDLFNRDAVKQRGVRLFVRRVFIMDDCEELVPLWLRFVRGVIDSDDLPLNVSREILQDNAVVRTMKKNVVRKALEMLQGLADRDRLGYDKAWAWFGAVLKEGLATDGRDHREALSKLVRYRSTAGDGLCSLDEYVGRMKEGQKAIYYVLGESEKAVAGSPHLELFRSRGYEVLLMSDPVDEFALQTLDEYDGKEILSVMKADLDLGEDEAKKAQRDEQTEELKPLIDRMERVLKDQVKEVRVSTRLTESPCCLVVPEGGQNAYMERIMRALDKEAPKTQRILEINAGHGVIRNLHRLLGDGGDLGRVDAWIELLYDQVLLSEGSPVDDPGRLARRISDLLQTASGNAISAASP